MQEWEENKMQMYVHPAHETWAISFPSNPCRAPKTQKKNHHHTPSQKTQTHTHRSLSFLTWANFLAEEANLTLPRNSRASDRRRSQPQHKRQTMAPKIATKTLRIPHTHHRETPDLHPSAQPHTQEPKTRRLTGDDDDDGEDEADGFWRCKTEG